MNAPRSELRRTGVKQIRTTHPGGYRCGEWAALAGRTPVRGRDCYVVRFGDGASDFWVAGDPDGRYEFRECGWACGDCDEPQPGDRPFDGLCDGCARNRIALEMPAALRRLWQR